MDPEFSTDGRRYSLVKALYASNVYHYDHVVEAMGRIFEDVGLVSRSEITLKQLESSFARRLPSNVIRLLQRRLHEPTFEVERHDSIGVAQYVLPLALRLGLPSSPSAIRAVTQAYARKVSGASGDYEFFQFVEGLGHKALKQRSFKVSICERRNFHHEVFETPIETFGGFPADFRRDPIRDILDYEYENADYILVYSESVRQSFIVRGFLPSKVRVSPIGLGLLPARICRTRQEETLLFVGRGDVFKGLDLAVAAVALLKAPYKLRVAGPMKASVRNWLEAQPHVEYLGILGREELSNEYARAALLLVPSIESFGLAAAEAVHQGLRILCSPTTGLSEYIPDEAKVVVNERDPNSWANAISIALEGSMENFNPDLALANLTMEICGRRLSDIYADMV